MSKTTSERKIVMVANQSMRLHTVANKQKLRSASSELNIPNAKAELVANEVMVMSGPAFDKAACTLTYEV